LCHFHVVRFMDKDKARFNVREGMSITNDVRCVLQIV
jgi:hypothetical protein